MLEVEILDFGTDAWTVGENVVIVFSVCIERDRMCMQLGPWSFLRTKPV